jgi:hypothetical protein
VQAAADVQAAAAEQAQHNAAGRKNSHSKQFARMRQLRSCIETRLHGQHALRSLTACRRNIQRSASNQLNWCRQMQHRIQHVQLLQVA